MCLRNWNTVLEIKQKKSNLTNNDRIRLIKDKIEELSKKKCFYKPSFPKKCSCLSLLQGDETAQEVVVLYILHWASFDSRHQKLFLIEKIKSVLMTE